MNNNKLTISMIISLALVGGIIGVTVFSFYTNEVGTTAIQIRLGGIAYVRNSPGLYFKIPMVDSISYINNRIQKINIKTEALSKDLQFVLVEVALNYKVDNAEGLYKEVGTHYKEIVIDPLAQESIKAIVAQYTAEELIQHRHEVKEKVLHDIRERLNPRYLSLVDFNFVHLDFHREFMLAVENKQIAQQQAMTAKNVTERVREEVLQKNLQSDAEVYALKVKKEALTPELIELQKIEKWDGKLPQTVTGTIPFINVK